MRLLLILALGLAIGCKAPVYTLDAPPEEYIIIGSFGGFSGAEESFHLFSNGQRYFVHSISGTVEMEKTSAKVYDQLEDALEEAGIEDMKLNESGNMNYFIELHEDDFTNRVQWTDGSKVPELFTETLRELQNEVYQNKES